MAPPFANPGSDPASMGARPTASTLVSPAKLRKKAMTKERTIYAAVSN